MHDIGPLDLEERRYNAEKARREEKRLRKLEIEKERRKLGPNKAFSRKITKKLTRLCSKIKLNSASKS